MRKLISLFLVLVMFLMLTPTALAAPLVITPNTGEAWGTATSLTPFIEHTFVISNPDASPTNANFNFGSPGDFLIDVGTGYAPDATGVDLGSNSSIPVTVKVKPVNPAIGTYNDVLTISYSELGFPPDTLSFSYSIEAAPTPSTPTDSIELHYNTAGSSPISGTHNFFSQYVGYNPESLILYIFNKGTTDLSAATVSLGSNLYFEVVTGPSTASLTQSSHTSAIIRPRSGLGAGTYSTTVTVNASPAPSKQFTVYFSVNSTGGGISTSNYSNRTLIDYATGVRVSGISLHNSATLSVTQNSLHSAGLCGACDTIRNYMSNGQVLSIYNISMTRSHLGTVNVSLPVSSGYNGNRLTIAHCNGGILESVDVYASNGLVTGSFSSLSPFAVLSGQYINTGDNTSNSNGIGPPKTDDPISYKALGELVILLTAVTWFVVMRSKRKAKR